jgi:hypothetical protein
MWDSFTTSASQLPDLGLFKIKIAPPPPTNIPQSMKIRTSLLIVLSGLSCNLAFAQSTLPINHPKDQIALQLGAIQMGYVVPFKLISGNSTNSQQAANALLMGRNALDATVAKPAAKVQGFATSPSVNTLEYRDQLYQAVEAVVTSPVVGSISGSVSVVGIGKKQAVSGKLSAPPNTYTIPVPFAVEAAYSVDTQELRSDLNELRSDLTEIGILPIPTPTPSLAVVTTLAGSGNAAYADGTGTNASFNSPMGVGLDATGNAYVADSGNHRIRKVTPAGVVTTLAGSGNAAYADGTGTNASFNSPDGVAIDASGNIYTADTYNHRIRKITLP